MKKTIMTLAILAVLMVMPLATALPRKMTQLRIPLKAETCMGDLNHDGRIDYTDVRFLTWSLYGKSRNDMSAGFWHQIGYFADFDKNKKIDLTDLAELLSKYGEKC